jgi:hypothetical protein
MAFIVVAISLGETNVPWEGLLRIYWSTVRAKPRWIRFSLLAILETTVEIRSDT